MKEELLKNIVILSIIVESLMIAAIAIMQVSIYKYKRKIYFIRRDRERCNELLFSVKDGYFCFIYPDEKVRDPQKATLEKCSRKLAVMLSLKDGTASDFQNVCDAFVKEDARLLKKYVDLLQQEGLAFEDLLHLKGKDCVYCVYGNRVNGIDGNLYCDVVWFRDVSAQAAKVLGLEEEKQLIQNAVKEFENMLDGVDDPLWLRDQNLNLLAVNKKYVEYSGLATKTDVLKQNVELNNNKGEAVARKIAAEAQKSKKAQKKNLNMIRDGELYHFEVTEKPYFVGDSLDDIGTIGRLKDISELERAKRSFKINQNTHLEILGVLGTAFAIFDSRAKLYFYNTSFKNLWGLDNEFLEKTPSYWQFIETIKEHKMLPPVPDFKAYKDDEMSIFNGLLETKEDLLHLPDGRTLRRLRTPHPNGVIFAFEDVSDRLATMRRLNDLTAMQQDILDNLSDAVMIFGANQRLKFYNRAYLKLWSTDFDKLQDEPKLENIIARQKLFFSHIENWADFSRSMLNNILQGQKFDLIRDDDIHIFVSPHVFYDGSVMITYSVRSAKE